MVMSLMWTMWRNANALWGVKVNSVTSVPQDTQGIHPMVDHLLLVLNVTVATKLHHVIQRPVCARIVLTTLLVIIVSIAMMVTIET